MKFKFRSLSLLTFSGLISVATLLLYNLPFFQFVHQHANPRWLLITSLVVVMLALNGMMAYLTLFLMRRVGRVVLAILAFINALATYFVLTYSIIVDEITIGNVFNTRYSEASGFFSWSLVGFMLVMGVIPAVCLLVQPIRYGKVKRLGRVCGYSLATILAMVAINYNQIMWFSQNDTELGGLLQPWSYVVNSIRVAAMNHSKQQEEILLPDGQITDQEKTAVVLVIGESARRANFQLYGYERATNPLLSKQEGLMAFPANSCATYTTAGTRAILEPTQEGDLHEILPNYAFRTGVDVSWRTYNWGEPPVHIDEYLTGAQLAEMYPSADPAYDELLFTGIKERIESSPKNKVLIIIHTNTSHGPDYVMHYPPKFQHFQPVLDNVEEAAKATDKLVNAYDNSLIYTDYLLSSLIDTLRGLSDWRTAMLYVSDHGESLGENNLFMHGVPMSVAPRQQYEIPFLVWLSSDFRQVKTEELPQVLEQHYVFHSVLNLLSISSPAYQSSFDIFQR